MDREITEWTCAEAKINVYEILASNAAAPYITVVINNNFNKVNKNTKLS